MDTKESENMNLAFLQEMNVVVVEEHSAGSWELAWAA